MTNSNPTARLMHLAQAEFEKHRKAPMRKRFRALNVSPSKYDETWDRRRGGAVRLMATVLASDDAELYRRISVDDQTAKTYAAAGEWFLRESAYLRKISRLMEMAASRLTVVVHRYGEEGRTKAD